jgi:pilus assembly protein Flp/PilA
MKRITRYLMTRIVRFLKDESGATSIEYGMLIGGIALVLIPVINALGESTLGKYVSLSNLFS